MTTPIDEQVRPSDDRYVEPAHTGPSRRWMLVFTSLLAASLLAAGVLTYIGVRTVRESRDGKSVSAVHDPARPGFEAFLEPTPTLVVLHRAGNKLASVAVLSLNSGDVGGSVLLVPPSTRVTRADDALSFAAVAAYSGSPDAILPSLQSLLGMGITEVVVADDARWAELLGPVAPLVIDNPDTVAEFAAGPLSLQPAQVGPYLAALGDGESDLARLFRQQLVFEAWADAVAASSDAGAVPGEVDSGIGRFVRGLAAGRRTVATLPVVETPLLAGGVRVDADPDAVTELIPTLVPFPTAEKPGGRVRVRLLDGAGDPQHVLTAAPLIVPAGSEIVVVGNADRFDYETTEIRYHDRRYEAAAERLRSALGGGRVVDDARHTDAFDVTIVLGTDV